MDFKEYLQHNIVILDGGMGSLLQARGLQPGEAPERWNLTHADDIIDIQKAYYDSGSNVVNTNTFGANLLHFDEDELEDIIKAAIDNANAAREQSTADHAKFVALDIGPTGRLLKPMGDLDFEEAVSIFAKTVQIGVSYGVDLIMIETMNDSYETKAALLAAKENSDLPVIVSNAYSENGKLMTGASPAAMVALLESMGADAIGVNCSFGPDKLAPIVREYLRYASVPVLLKPNAGLPHSENGCTVYDILPEEFSQITACLVREGVRVAGGCCGTTPEYIKNLCDKINVTRATQESSSDNLYNPSASCLGTSLYQREAYTVISSYTHAVFFTDDPVLIGERINPTGKKKLKKALCENDIEYILKEGISQSDAGAHILDVNVGLPEIDEKKMMAKAVYEIQSILPLPLCIDSSSPDVLEAALRIYNGKPIINSVNGKQEVMNSVLPLAAKYGGVLIALTIDEGGIPDTAQGRFEIAEKIVNEAAKYGIAPKDIMVDCLTLTISSDPNAAEITLEAVKMIK